MLFAASGWQRVPGRDGRWEPVPSAFAERIAGQPPMSTGHGTTAGCARCGDCCDPVPFDRASLAELARWTSSALVGVPDPADDIGWSHWRAHGWPEVSREGAVSRFDPAGTWRADADFVATHWKAVSDQDCECDMFDRESRMCTAHDRRPPVCRGYPWYGRDAVSGRFLPARCSYLADLPPQRRPEGSRPLIPLMVA